MKLHDLAYSEQKVDRRMDAMKRGGGVGVEVSADERESYQPESRLWAGYRRQSWFVSGRDRGVLGISASDCSTSVKYMPHYYRIS